MTSSPAPPTSGSRRPTAPSPPTSACSTEPGGGHRIGRVVTDPAHRGAALAGRLIDHALTLAERPVVLDAQSHLVHVYARHGFAPDGPEFLDDGIPHTPMRLA